MEFFGYFIGDVVEEDESYLFKLLHKGLHEDIIISCVMRNKTDKTKKEIEQYIEDEDRVSVKGILLKNSVVNREESQEAELHMAVYDIEYVC